MRKPLLIKLVLCYLLVTLSLFLLLNTFGAQQAKKNVYNHQKNLLYSEADFIYSNYMRDYYGGTATLVELRSQLQSTATFLDARIWIVNKEGDVLLDTSESNTAENANITALDPDFLDSDFPSSSIIDKAFSEPCLNVVYRVSSEYSIKGYIVLRYSLENVQAVYVDFSNVINFCLLLALIILLAVFAYIYWITVYPLKIILQSAMEYSLSHYEYPLNIKSQDEYGDLSDAISYMASELSNLDDYRRNFIANISHDFRSPLTSIRGYAEAMLDGTIPAELQPKYLNIILFEADRLTDLTSDLLTLNSFDNNGNLLDITDFDINTIIKSTSESFEGICTRKMITLQLEFMEKSTYVTADMGKIQQVLYNLIDNAIKFSKADSVIKVSTAEKNDKIFISVKDFGCGIPKDSIKKVWERFYKTDSSRGKDKKGTGLGLAITREIINAHNENINVISTEGVGSEFTFSLPKKS